MIELQVIDYSILGFYLVLILTLGIFCQRAIKTRKDFFLAGRTLPFWVVGVTLVVTDFQLFDYIAGAGGSFKYGIAQANYDWMGAVPAMLIAAVFFIPHLYRSEVSSIPEYLGRRFNGLTQLITALMWILFLIVNLASILWMSSTFFQKFFGWDAVYFICLLGGFIGLYSLIGGAFAVSYTDVMQFLVVLLGIGMFTIAVYFEVGGYHGLIEATEKHNLSEHFSLLLPHDTASPYPWSGIVLGLGTVLSLSIFVSHQVTVQRVLGAQSEWDAKAGMVFAGFLKLLIPLFIVLPGIAMIAIDPELKEPQNIIFHLMDRVLPSGAIGLMLAALLALLMSSLDAFLNSCATVLTNDVLLVAFKRKAEESPKKELLIARGSTLFIILITTGLALIISGVESGAFWVLRDLFSYFQGPVLALIILGIYWRKATGIASVIGLVSGILFTYLLYDVAQEVLPSENPFLLLSVFSFLFTLLITAFFSLVTPREPPEKLAGLVWGESVRDPRVQAALKAKLSVEEENL